MELTALYKRVIGLDVHQKQITACALIEEADGTVRICRVESAVPAHSGAAHPSASNCGF